MRTWRKPFAISSVAVILLAVVVYAYDPSRRTVMLIAWLFALIWIVLALISVLTLLLGWMADSGTITVTSQDITINGDRGSRIRLDRVDSIVLDARNLHAITLIVREGATERTMGVPPNLDLRVMKEMIGTKLQVRE